MLNQNLDNLKNILLASNVGITILGIIFFLLFCVVFIVVRNKNRKKQKISLVSITPTPLESNVEQKKLKDFEDNLLKKDFKQRLQD